MYKKISCWVHKLIVQINPVIEINRCYKKVFGKKPNLKCPQSLIERIYWLILHSDISSWSILADKYLMRKYVQDKGLGDFLPCLYAKWDNPSQIDFNKLPNSFVLKTNNGCGDIIVINDKNQINEKEVIKKISKTFSIPFGYSGYQPHYLKIKPCIIAEELLIQTEELSKFSPESMVDFKFWCFNGEVECCLITYGRSKRNLYIDLYDCEWNRKIEYLTEYGNERINKSINIPRPKCLDKMISIASKLSQGHPEMRVDLYVINDEPVIGELTMTSGYGYFTDEYYKYLGSLIDLSLYPRIK